MREDFDNFRSLKIVYKNILINKGEQKEIAAVVLFDKTV